MQRIKLTLISCLLLSTLTFNSCSKKEDKTGAAQKSEVKAKALTSVETMTAGEMHNFFLAEYKTRYGLPQVVTGTVTNTVMHLIYSRMTQIAIDNGILITNDPDRFTDEQFEGLVTDGFFNNNGILKDVESLAIISINKIQNTDIRNALTDINGHYASADFLNYANQRLALLTNLNTHDQQTVDGYASVLSSSYEFWQDEPISYPMGVGSVARADGSGWSYGADQAGSGWFYLISVIALPAYHAAARSVAAVH
jgi:hypothetical protein